MCQFGIEKMSKLSSFSVSISTEKFAQICLVCICSEIGARRIVLACHLLIQLGLTFHTIHIRRKNYAH